MKIRLKYFLFLIIVAATLFRSNLLGARYSDQGMELVKFMTLKNSYCTTQIFHEYNKYDEINKYLKFAFLLYPRFLAEREGLRLKEEAFYNQERELDIHVISDQTLNSRVIARFGILLPVDGLYDPSTRTIYISKDFDLSTIVHEYFHFLRDISGIALAHDREEELADQFADVVVDAMGLEQALFAVNDCQRR
ncbi:MAG: hypothetical protein R3231_02350 [bacterium]|nr:hypothetical protein [bacterium]